MNKMNLTSGYKSVHSVLTESNTGKSKHLGIFVSRNLK